MPPARFGRAKIRTDTRNAKFSGRLTAADAGGLWVETLEVDREDAEALRRKGRRTRRVAVRVRRENDQTVLKVHSCCFNRANRSLTLRILSLNSARYFPALSERPNYST